jgi:putative transposase
MIASVAKPETILARYRKLIARRFDGSKHRVYPGLPAVGREVTELVVWMARENGGWGYDRIAGALKNLGHCVSDQTVDNILRRFDIRSRAKTSSANDLCRVHSISHGGSNRCRFFTVEVLTWRGPITYYLLFFCTWTRAMSASRE